MKSERSRGDVARQRVRSRKVISSSHLSERVLTITWSERRRRKFRGAFRSLVTFFSASWPGYPPWNSRIVAGFTTSFPPLRYPAIYHPLHLLPSSPLFSYRRWYSAYAHPLFVIRPSFLTEREKEREREISPSSGVSSRPSRWRDSHLLTKGWKRAGHGKLILNAEVGHLVYFFINSLANGPFCRTLICSYMRVFPRRAPTSWIVSGLLLKNLVPWVIRSFFFLWVSRKEARHFLRVKVFLKYHFFFLSNLLSRDHLRTPNS